MRIQIIVLNVPCGRNNFIKTKLSTFIRKKIHEYSTSVGLTVKVKEYTGMKILDEQIHRFLYYPNQ